MVRGPGAAGAAAAAGRTVRAGRDQAGESAPGLPRRHRRQLLLPADLHATRADGGYSRRFARLCTVDLPVPDDFGLRGLTAREAEDLFDPIRERYERKAT